MLCESSGVASIFTGAHYIMSTLNEKGTKVEMEARVSPFQVKLAAERIDQVADRQDG